MPTLDPMSHRQQMVVGAVGLVVAAPAIIGTVAGISATGPVSGGLYAVAQSQSIV